MDWKVHKDAAIPFLWRGHAGFDAAVGRYEGIGASGAERWKAWVRTTTGKRAVERAWRVEKKAEVVWRDPFNMRRFWSSFCVLGLPTPDSAALPIAAGRKGLAYPHARTLPSETDDFPPRAGAFGEKLSRSRRPAVNNEEQETAGHARGV